MAMEIVRDQDLRVFSLNKNETLMSINSGRPYRLLHEAPQDLTAATEQLHALNHAPIPFNDEYALGPARVNGGLDQNRLAFYARPRVPANPAQESTRIPSESPAA